MEKYGPFATIMALAICAVAFVLALMFVFKAKYSGWRPPDQGLPGRLFTAVIVVLAACGYLIFTEITPTNRRLFMVLGIALVISFALLIPIYQRMVNVYFFEKPAKVEKDPATGDQVVTEWRVVVGGRRILPEAQKAMAKHKIKVREFYKGTGPQTYDEDQIWDVNDRQSVQMLMSYILLGILCFGMAGITLVLFSTQVYITNTRPAFTTQQIQDLQKNTKAPETTE